MSGHGGCPTSSEFMAVEPHARLRFLSKKLGGVGFDREATCKGNWNREKPSGTSPTFSPEQCMLVCRDFDALLFSKPRVSRIFIYVEC